MDAASSFYDEFYSYYGIPVPSMQTAQPSLPPRPGASQLRPPPPIPFHSRPIPSAQLSSAPAPISQSRNPFLAAPLPVPPFNPLPTNSFLCAVTPSDNNGSLSLATSSTGDELNRRLSKRNQSKSRVVRGYCSEIKDITQKKSER